VPGSIQKWNGNGNGWLAARLSSRTAPVFR